MVNAYSYPEQIAFSPLENDLYKAFASAGFEVDVVTPIPTRGISDETYREYRGRLEESFFGGKVRFHRIRLIREKRNPLLRMLRYVIGNVKTYFRCARLNGVSVILGASTPPTQGLLCGMIKSRLRVPFIYYLCDVFPDSMTNSGLTSKGSLLWKIGSKIERVTYAKADRILVVSQDIQENLIKKGVQSEKIRIVYNWIDTDAVKPVPREENCLFDELKLPRDRFYVTYAGNLGMAQGVDILVDAAGILQSENVQFVIFGNGAEEGTIRRKIESLRLSNIRLFPILPSARISEVYSLGNASLVSCKKGFGGVGMPSKTWSILATATPVLLSFDDHTELKDIIVQNSCGIFSDADDCRALADNIMKLRGMDPDSLRILGMNGRKFVENNMSKKLCTGRMTDVMTEVIKGRKQK